MGSPTPGFEVTCFILLGCLQAVNLLVSFGCRVHANAELDSVSEIPRPRSRVHVGELGVTVQPGGDLQVCGQMLVLDSQATIICLFYERQTRESVTPKFLQVPTWTEMLLSRICMYLFMYICINRFSPRRPNWTVSVVGAPDHEDRVRLKWAQTKCCLKSTSPTKVQFPNSVRLWGPLERGRYFTLWRCGSVDKALHIYIYIHMCASLPEASSDRSRS